VDLFSTTWISTFRRRVRIRRCFKTSLVRRSSLLCGWSCGLSETPPFLGTLLRDNETSALGSDILRIRVQKGFFTSTIGLTILGIVLRRGFCCGGIFTYYYVKYSR